MALSLGIIVLLGLAFNKAFEKLKLPGLFSAFLRLYGNHNINILRQVLDILISIVLGIALGIHPFIEKKFIG